MVINDLSKKIAQLRPSINEAFSRVLERGLLVLGPEVTSLEESFGTYLGVDFCCTVANGTDALELALRSIGVEKGDKVATIANAGFYASSALLAIGAAPFYLDVDIETKLITLSEVEQAIHYGVKAIVVTHLYGRIVPEIEKIAKYCREADVPLIEDCAQAHGAIMNGKRAGSFGNIGCFSFYPTKNLGALGDGGAIVCNDAILAKKIEQLRQYGWSKKYQVGLVGGRNSRLDEMQAAFLNVFLTHLDLWNNQRRAIAAKYTACITHPAIMLPHQAKEDDVVHLYVIRSLKRDALRAYLREQHIAAEIHYPIPDHHQPIFKNQWMHLHLPNTELLAKEILTLPCYPEMSQEAIAQVVSALNSWSTEA